MISPQDAAEYLSPETLIDHVLGESAARVCITCSFQAEDMVDLHMLPRRIAQVPVLFLDTGYHFDETYAYRDRVTSAWKLDWRNLPPAMRGPGQEQAVSIPTRTY